MGKSTGIWSRKLICEVLILNFLWMKWHRNTWIRTVPPNIKNAKQNKPAKLVDLPSKLILSVTSVPAKIVCPYFEIVINSNVSQEDKIIRREFACSWNGQRSTSVSRLLSASTSPVLSSLTHFGSLCSKMCS